MLWAGQTEAKQACPDAEREVLCSDLTAVTDRGNSIPADETEKIFKAFCTTKPQGLGMGLSICRSIITSHQGRRWAENNPGRGAAFYIGLPAARTYQLCMTAGGTLLPLNPFKPFIGPYRTKVLFSNPDPN